MGYDKKTCQDMIDRCLEEGQGLSQWERNTFLPGVDDYLSRNGYLSEGQQEILERIYKQRVYR